MQKFDETPNDYEILMSRPTEATRLTVAGRVILAKAPEGRDHKYVVAWQGEGETGWHHGQYIVKYERALEAFKERW